MNIYIDLLGKEIAQMKSMRTKIWDLKPHNDSEKKSKKDKLNEIDRHLANILVGNVGLVDLAKYEIRDCISYGNDLIKENKESENEYE